MPRYVLSNRRAGKFKLDAKVASREQAATFWRNQLERNVKVIADHAPADESRRRVVLFEADRAEMSRKAPSNPDVLVEEERLHHVRLPVGAELARGPLARWESLQVTVRADGRPLPGATVSVTLVDAAGAAKELPANTDPQGAARFHGDDPSLSLAAVVALPAAEYWSTLVRAPAQAAIVIDCPPLPASGPVMWWHRLAGIERFDESRGRGIRVGVVDTGVGPNPCLTAVTDIGAYVGNVHDPHGGADVSNHGTHVCGLIAARPRAPGQVGGIAPGVELLSARVFPPSGGANQADVACAIDALSKDHRSDLVNLSLVADEPSAIEQDAIRDALERGTLCICAAGNRAGALTWPGAFPEAVAVSAFGRNGWGPASSMFAAMLPTERDRFGGDELYLANFSSFGSALGCGAPGVGLLSTVPSREGEPAAFAAMAGTSIASPVACAVAAVLMSESSAYRALARDAKRAQAARQLLVEHCRSVGLIAAYEGAGLPRAR
jgi:subtilisin